mmetsp:Transcript_61842/g.147544  ORF Transcript_61842/g.147544 Transcript_61842/m.147544 type:complete len:255 (-) Transcript_61842:130-894(-)
MLHVSSTWISISIAAGAAGAPTSPSSIALALLSLPAAPLLLLLPVGTATEAGWGRTTPVDTGCIATPAVAPGVTMSALRAAHKNCRWAVSSALTPNTFRTAKLNDPMTVSCLSLSLSESDVEPSGRSLLLAHTLSSFKLSLNSSTPANHKCTKSAVNSISSLKSASKLRMHVQSAESRIKRTRACVGRVGSRPQIKKNLAVMRMQPPTTDTSLSRSAPGSGPMMGTYKATCMDKRPIGIAMQRIREHVHVTQHL